jgi:predicted TIM-barrel fold metal-dependent hydrolase
MSVDSSPYLVVSADSHAGPMLETLRLYVPHSLLDAFDDHVRSIQASGATGMFASTVTSEFGEVSQDDPRQGLLSAEEIREGKERVLRAWENRGSYDPAQRLLDMDADGICAEVIFAGAQNGQELPWIGGLGTSATTGSELKVAGRWIWNRWLADFCGESPDRLLGVIEITISDVGEAVRQVYWGAEHGLRAINFPAPRPDYPSYNSDVYEPFWSAVEDVGLPLVTHNASGEQSFGSAGKGALLLGLYEALWLSRRGLQQLIFGGVFDRHPGLTVGFVEQRGNWIPSTLMELDSAYHGVPRNAVSSTMLGNTLDMPSRAPSEYWYSNCFVGDSFMAPFEAQMRAEIGIDNLLWGSDYPHVEGTWPRSRLAMRNTFAGVPEPDVRQILEINPTRIFRIDRARLRPIADRIGPSPLEISKPLEVGEFPAYRGLAFREKGEVH